MTNDEQIRQVELDIENAKDLVKKGEAVKRLMDNPDFKAIFTEQYFKEEAARLVMLRAHWEFQTEEKQADILKDIDAIGRCSEFLRGVVIRGNQAERAINEHRNTLTELEDEV